MRIQIISLKRRSMLAMLLALATPVAAQTTDNKGGEAGVTRIQFITGGNVLTATLDNTAVAQEFAKLLPLDLTLTDYHGIEKIADLPRKLDTSAAPASYAPEAGDIALYAPWGNLAIFYKPFRESPGLVRLGEFDGPYDALVRDEDTSVRIQTSE